MVLEAHYAEEVGLRFPSAEVSDKYRKWFCTPKMCLPLPPPVGEDAEVSDLPTKLLNKNKKLLFSEQGAFAIKTRPIFGHIEIAEFFSPTTSKFFDCLVCRVVSEQTRFGRIWK